MKQLFFNKTSNERGFTLMEMLIVVTIIGILASVIIPRFMTSSQEARVAAYEADRQMINTQLELFYFENGSYPSAMTNTGWGDDFANFFPDGVPTGSALGQPWVIRNGRVDAQTP